MKKLFAIILSLFLATSLYASQFTTNYNLEIPAIGARDWQPVISKDIISIDTVVGILSSDFASGMISMTALSIKVNIISSEVGIISSDSAIQDTKIQIISNDSVIQDTKIQIISNDSVIQNTKLQILSNDSAWSKSGNNVFLVDAAIKNVGIGDTTPTASMDIATTSTTTNGLSVIGSSLTTGSLGYLYSDSTSASHRHLLEVVNDNIAANATFCITAQNDGQGNANSVGLSIGGVWDAGYGIDVVGGSLTTGHLARFYSDSASATARNLVTIVNDNSGGTANSTVCLRLQQDGTESAISADSGAALLNSGVWADGPSTFSEKLNVSEVIPNGYTEKLKTLKLYNYQKKREVYGSKEDILSETFDTVSDEYKDEKLVEKPIWYREEKDGKNYVIKDKKRYEVIGKEYSDIKLMPDAPFHTGYVLDDPSTPEELICRKPDGGIAGISPAQGVDFLLGVNKELVDRLEKLEKRVNDLEVLHK